MALGPPPEGALQVTSLGEVAGGQVVEEAPAFLCRSDGQSLLYPATINSLQGEPGSGKTWVALAAVAAAVRGGGNAVLADYEDGPTTATARLLALGLTVPDLDQIAYLQVTGRLSEEDLAWLGELSKLGVDLVVIDSVPESLAAEELDENHSGEVGRWVSRLPRPLARAGACVVLVDHVSKSKEGRGRWARGSGAKLAQVDGAAYSLDVEVPFSRSTSGTASLVVAKDRRGMVGPTGHVAAGVRFEVEGGSLRRVVLDPPSPVPVGHRGYATSKRLSAQEVRDVLAKCGGRWATRAEAAKALDVSTNTVAAVLAPALAAGLIVRTAQGRGFSYSLPDWADQRPQVLDLEAERRRRGGPL